MLSMYFVDIYILRNLHIYVLTLKGCVIDAEGLQYPPRLGLTLYYGGLSPQ